MHVEEVARAILTIEGVQEVHDVHIWSLGGGHNALSLHARVPDMHMDECERILIRFRKKRRRVSDQPHYGAVGTRRPSAISGYVMPEPAKK